MRSAEDGGMLASTLSVAAGVVKYATTKSIPSSID
jgi:hypothetical protein